MNLLKTLGYHRLKTDDMEIEKIAVNINSEELQSQIRNFMDIKEFINREKKWLKKGGKFILPYPTFKVLK